NCRSDRWLSEIRLFRKIWNLVWSVKPAILHVFTLRAIIYGVVASYAFNSTVVVCSITGLGYLFISTSRRAVFYRSILISLLRLLRGRLSLCIFQNHDDLELFVDRHIARVDRDVIIRGSGVDTTWFVPAEEPAGEVVVLFPARLLWHKGV